MTIFRIVSKAIAAAAMICVASAQPTVTAVLNAASYSAAISPGCWIAIFGLSLAPGKQAASGSLTTTLDGVSVAVGTSPAQLLYVSPAQVNALIPLDVAVPADTVVPLTVKSQSGTSKPFNLRLSRNAPGIFTQSATGTGRALFFDASFKNLDTVRGDEAAIFYATGLGPVDGSGKVIDPVDVYVGDRPAKVLSATLAPGFPGVYQVNVMTPAPATDRLFVRAGGWQSNIADIGIRPGENVANATGDIEGLYPSADPFFTLPKCNDEFSPTPCSAGQVFSIMLHAASFRIAFDIVPSATPFFVAAVTPAGSSLILIDAVAGTYNASVSTVSPQAAIGDFSKSVVPLWDYLGCDNNAACPAIPGPSLLPANRLLPWWGQAVRQLPVPASWAEASPNAVVQVSGTLTGRHFIVDTSTNSGLSRFGGIVQVPLGPVEQLTSTMKLYVDGRLLASKDVPYHVVYRFVSPEP